MTDIFSTIVPPVQETRKSKVKILTPIEEMFLARESTLRDAKGDLLKSEKVKQETKYKRFKNRVGPLNEDEDVHGNKKAKRNEKKKKRSEPRFASLFGFFGVWLKTRRQWKPKKSKAKYMYEVYQEVDKCDDGAPGRGQALETDADSFLSI